MILTCDPKQIYAPWCGHCQALDPIYNKLGKHLRGVDSLVIAKMDGTTNEHPRAKVVFDLLSLHHLITLRILKSSKGCVRFYILEICLPVTCKLYCILVYVYQHLSIRKEISKEAKDLLKT